MKHKYVKHSLWDFGDPRCGVDLPEKIDTTGSKGRTMADALRILDELEASIRKRRGLLG